MAPSAIQNPNKLRDRRNLGIGIIEALEQGQRHGARKVARHSKAGDHEEDWKGQRPEPADHLLDRRDHCRGETPMLMRRGEIGLGLGRDEGGDRSDRYQRRHAKIGEAPPISIGEQQRAGAGGERPDAVSHLRNRRHDRLLRNRN